jgi:hypothetical protein
MPQVAIAEALDGKIVDWMAHVSDALAASRANRFEHSRQRQLAMLGFAKMAGVRHHDVGHRAQPRDDRARVFEPTHMTQS